MLRQHVSTDDLSHILKYISNLEKKPNESTIVSAETQVDEEEDESMDSEEESNSISSTDSEDS